MTYRRTYLTTVAASIVLLACADQPPTAPKLSPVSDASASVRKKGGGTLTSVVDQTIAGNVISATMRVTRITVSSAGQLLASGVLSGTANGISFSQAFTDIPATLSGGSAGGASTDAVTAAASGPSVQQVGACDILLLDLGPLHLDVLGLVVDLNEVVLDIAAQAGAGNLLGNLLCAVVHLLDGPGILVAVANILDQVNAILGVL
ncbi:MAG TPA: hypothetical protein VKH19_17160 [Gemmatimonadaceae bacterium]|nr:hypothetical protein [Gemmatimonadaceae bacterium]